MKWCKDCKARYDDSACFCLRCGARLVSHEEYIASLEEQLSRLREEREEKERRDKKLNEQQTNERKIREIKNVLGYNATQIAYHGSYLSETNTPVVNLMYDIIINKKYSCYSLSNMIEEDKTYIKDKVNKVLYYADELYRKTRHRFNKDTASLIKEALPKMMNAIFSGGRFKGYKRKPSTSMYDTGISFESYSYEVKYSIYSLQNEIKRGGSNHIVEFYHAKGILARLKYIVDSIYRSVSYCASNTDDVCNAYQDLEPKMLDKLEATYLGLDIKW